MRLKDHARRRLSLISVLVGFRVVTTSYANLKLIGQVFRGLYCQSARRTDICKQFGSGCEQPIIHFCEAKISTTYDINTLAEEK